jgi:hypothetical protein
MPCDSERSGGICGLIRESQSALRYPLPAFAYSYGESSDSRSTGQAVRLWRLNSHFVRPKAIFASRASLREDSCYAQWRND